MLFRSSVFPRLLEIRSSIKLGKFRKFCVVHAAEMDIGDREKVVRLPRQGESGWSELVASARGLLLQQKIVSVPTDTIYGLAGLAQSNAAVEEIYAIKGRDCTKAVSICVGDVQDVYRWGKVTISDTLLGALLPGPVTVIFERTAELNPKLNPTHSNVGIRVPDYGFVRAVARACQEPLALTSANFNAAPSTLSVEEFKNLWPRLAAVYDGGVLGDTDLSRLGSTVVDLSRPGIYSIVRPGSAHKETIALLTSHGLQPQNSSGVR